MGEHWTAKYRVDVPEGVSGEWSVSRFTVSEQDAAYTRMRAALNPRERGREVPAGTYTQLRRGRTLVMSDTPAEIMDHLDFIHAATGRVLIHGLGLGMVLKAVLAKPDVTHVDVVEISEDVIRLVAPSYADPRVRIRHGDALTYRWPVGFSWDAVWHDVWDNICGDNLPSMKTLHRRYGKRTRWQGSWAREQCEGRY